MVFLTRQECLVLLTVMVAVCVGTLIRFGSEHIPALDHALHFLEKADVGPKIDINCASKDKLLDVPGIGPVMAQRILEYRQTRGGFQSVADLKNIAGMGPKKLQKFSLYFRVHEKP